MEIETIIIIVRIILTLNLGFVLISLLFYIFAQCKNAFEFGELVLTTKTVFYLSIDIVPKILWICILFCSIWLLPLPIALLVITICSLIYNHFDY